MFMAGVRDWGFGIGDWESVTIAASGFLSLTAESRPLTASCFAILHSPLLLLILALHRSCPHYTRRAPPPSAKMATPRRRMPNRRRRQKDARAGRSPLGLPAPPALHGFAPVGRSRPGTGSCPVRRTCSNFRRAASTRKPPVWLRLPGALLLRVRGAAVRGVVAPVARTFLALDETPMKHAVGMQRRHAVRRPFA